MSYDPTVRESKTLTDIEYLVLKAILEQPLSGIGIFESVAVQTGNKILLNPGTLYAALRRMYGEGLIDMVAPEEYGYSSSEKRKIYTATEKGFDVFRERVVWLVEQGQAGQEIIAKRERKA